MAVFLKDFTPFDATQEFFFWFETSGVNQVIIANRLIVEDVALGEEVYNVQISTTSYRHILSANTLTNGNQYAARILIYSNTGLIGTSPNKFFYVFSPPSLDIPTVATGEVGAESILFEGTYSQPESEPLQSYKFDLYNSTRSIIGSSGWIYQSTPIEYEFGGLENEIEYGIKLSIISVNGIVAETEIYAFTPKYFSPFLQSAMSLSMDSANAKINISCRVLRIIGSAEIQPPVYIDGNKIDLTANTAFFDEAFNVGSDFTLQLFISNLQVGEIMSLITLGGTMGFYLELKSNNELILRKARGSYVLQRIVGNLDPVFPSAINPSNQIYIYIQQRSGLINFKYQEVI